MTSGEIRSGYKTIQQANLQQGIRPRHEDESHHHADCCSRGVSPSLNLAAYSMWTSCSLACMFTRSKPHLISVLCMLCRSSGTPIARLSLDVAHEQNVLYYLSEQPGEAKWPHTQLLPMFVLRIHPVPFGGQEQDANGGAAGPVRQTVITCAGRSYNNDLPW